MRKVRLGSCLMVLALAAGACSSDEATGPAEASKNVQVDQFDKVLPLSRLHEGPAILIDKDDPDIVYLANSEMVTGECRFYVSVNRGISWRQENAPVLKPFTDNCAQGNATSQNLRTELQQGPDGTIYNVFQANAPDRLGSRSVMLGMSKDGGRSWKTVAIDPGKIAPEQGQQMEVNFEGHLAIDPANPSTIYATWRRSFNRFPAPAPPTRPMFSVSTDGGNTWATPVVMLEKNSGFDGPRPIVVGNKLFAFYRESAPPNPGPNDPPLPEPPTTKLRVAISEDGGKTWPKDIEIGRAGDASEPIPLYDRERQRFYVVWHDNRDKELDAYFSSSADGEQWAAPKLLNDDPRGTRTAQHYPQISLSPDGRIDVAWYDWRDDPFPPPTVGTGQTLSLFTNRGKVASVYLTSSRDGGATWTRNTKVNDVPIDRTIGSWINNIDVMSPIAIASDDKGALIAWSDTRNGNAISQTQDIFTTTVTFGEPAGRKVTPLQAGLAGGLFGLGIAMCLAVLLFRRQNPPKAPEQKKVKEEAPVG
ncbi:MAG: sialidase family protein [Acidimicrobiales bacterium]